MTTTSAERYRDHPVWRALQAKIDALDAPRFQRESAEQARAQVVDSLRIGMQSRSNVSRASLYLEALDRLNEILGQQIPTDENNFEQGYFTRAPYQQLAAALRSLPGPTPRGLTDAHVEVLDESVAFRRDQLTGLKSEVSELSAEIAEKRRELEALKEVIERSKEENADARSRIVQTAEDGQQVLESEWAAKLIEWDKDRYQRDQELDRQIDEKLGLLTYAAQAAERLVEYAAGRFTARDWSDRAAREYRLGYLMRRGAIGAFIAAGLVGAVLVTEAIRREHGLDVGGSLLRIAVVGAIAALGYYLSRESRKHLDEAGSAEEVAVALQALEPYYASASGETRAAAREAVGEMLFVRNIQSRFAARDASKHNGMDNQQLNELMDTLTKSADLGRKATGA
jgi:outer membrane murein-binding lipoprotein Lpp